MSQNQYDGIPRWYVVHTYSGYENIQYEIEEEKNIIKNNLEKNEIKNIENHTKKI